MIKTRIKKVTNGFGVDFYYPQVRDFFIWSCLYRVGPWEHSEKIVCLNIDEAKEEIDNYLQQQADKKKRNQTSVTYIKYP